MKFKSDIEVQAGLKDSSGAAGTSGQVLSSNGTTVSWVNAGSSVASDVQNQVKAGVAINKGQAVYVTSADGTNIIVGLASNTSEATSSKTLGLLNATVAVNGFADVVQIGKLAGLNTIGANVGDPVWLGANGNLIYGLANKPYAPLHLVYIGVVTRVNANNGEIFINVQNGFELKELHDVSAQTPSNNNGIFYNTSNGLWEAKAISAAGGIEGSGTTNYVSKFTGASTIGNSLIYDNGTNVGIGTTLPNALLQTTGTNASGIISSLALENFISTNPASGNGVAIDFRINNSGNPSYIAGKISLVNTFYRSNTDMTFSVANSDILSERMRITSSGNVNIGGTSIYDTGSPGLTIYDPVTSTPAIVLQRGLPNANGDWKFQNTGGNLYISDGYDAGTPSAWRSPALAITAGNGNVGIGTSSPSVRFNVVGNEAYNWTSTMSSSLTSGHNLYFGYNNNVNTTYGLLITGGRSLANQVDLGVENKFYVNGNGNVLIGTTTDAGYKLDVAGTGRFNGSLQVGQGGGGTGTPTQSVFQDTYGGNRETIYVKNTADYAIGRGTGYGFLSGAGTQKGYIRWSADDASQTGYFLTLGVTNSSGTLIAPLTIASTGAASFSSLAGTGTRIVTADANGVLSTTTDGAITTYNSTLTLDTTWKNTGITSANLTTQGVYLVTCFVNDYGVGGGQYSCTYVGTMFFYTGGTNGVNANEIPLHHSGHADQGRYIYLRTLSSLSAGDGKLYLQIKGNGSNSANSTYAFTFKKLL